MYIFVGEKVIILDLVMETMIMCANQNQSLDCKAKKLFNFLQVLMNYIS